MTPKAANPSTRKDDRLGEILDEAARVFNAYGARGLNIADISKRLGLTRATLYNYISDRDELIFRCYQNTNEALAEYLCEADATETRGLDKVLKFVRRALSNEGQPLAVLADLHSLPQEYRSSVESADRNNDARLEEFIDLGISDGSIRECRADIVCHAIAGIVACSGTRYWLPSSNATRRRSTTPIPSSESDVIVQLLERGIGAAKFAKRMHFPIDATPVSHPLRNPFGRSVMVEMKHDYILTIASRLFNRFSVEGTSLDDVAAEIGVSKAVIYNYVTNKNDLLVKCYNRALDLYERYAEESEKVGRFGLEKSLMPLHLNIQAQMLGFSPLILISRTFGLENDDQSAIGQRAQSFVERINAMCVEGLEDGSILIKDYKAAVLASSGAVSWLPRRANPQLASMPRLVANEYVNLFAKGLKQW